MDTVLKNVLICGAAVLFTIGFLAIVQLQTSQATIEAAEIDAAALGRSDAQLSAEAGERFFLAAAYGWGPTDIPGFDMELYRECLDEIIELRIFENYGDVFRAPRPEDHYRELTERPRNTLIYAESFNSEVLRSLPSSAITGCKLPKPISQSELVDVPAA